MTVNRHHPAATPRCGAERMLVSVTKQAVRVATQYAPAPLLSPWAQASSGRDRPLCRQRHLPVSNMF